MHAGLNIVGLCQGDRFSPVDLARVTRTCSTKNPTSTSTYNASPSCSCRAHWAIMGQKADQNPFRSTCRPSDQAQKAEAGQQPQRGPPPPLPPRAGDTSLPTSLEAPPSYSETAPTYHSQPLSHSWTCQDPRSSSTESLVPHEDTEDNGKRTLLLVYIHGFMGNETSFQSFPAHVHNVVTVVLEGSHDVHTKIYPKYKSRKHIEFARDGLSEW